MTRTNQELSNNEQGRKRCRGSTTQSTWFEEAAALRPAGLSSNSVRTYQESKPSCASPMTSQKESLLLNGTVCSKESQLTSTKSSPPCTLSTLMKRERATWAQLKLFLWSQNQSNTSELELNGLLPSEECPRRSYSSSLTKETSCSSTPTILRGISKSWTLYGGLQQSTAVLHRCCIYP